MPIVRLVLGCGSSRKGTVTLYTRRNLAFESSDSHNYQFLAEFRRIFGFGFVCEECPPTSVGGHEVFSVRAHVRVLGLSSNQVSNESLILAQNQRWRRA